MDDSMVRQIHDIVLGVPGKVAVYLRDTAAAEDTAYTFHAREPLEAASVIKLYVMAEAFHQREEGLLDFDETIEIREEDKLPSCGALTYMHAGLRVTLRDLVTLMIILSDNTATNLLIDRLGQDRINLLIRSLADTQTAWNTERGQAPSGQQGPTALNRKLFQPELARRGIRNTVSAMDVGLLLTRMLQGTLISQSASREMLSILLDQRLNGKMPFHLHNRGVRCAHKTGEDDGITHDVGIIFAETPRILCFLSESTDVPTAERALQEIARLAAM